MQSDFLTVALGFAEGFALILSPCILPILPIILSGSVTSGKKRPLGIIIGFVFIFCLFTLFARKLVLISGIDLNIIRNISFVLLILFGLILISTYLSDKFAHLTNKISLLGNKFTASNDINQNQGFISGIFFGGVVALIWTPCGGPILAAVIVQSVLQKTDFISFLIIFAFAMGSAIPMFFIALFGRKIINKVSFLKTNSQRIRQILGFIIILSVGFMFFNANITETTFPKSQSTKLTQTTKDANVTKTNTTLTNGLDSPYDAPNLSGIENWINTESFTMESLKGKVVLLDFWAYSCINCIRTIPYLNNWYEKYHDKGFTIIGVHSPEFDFERNLNNLTSAVQKNEIKYPIAADNNFKTWENYKNNYWPAHYLINKDGKVVYVHFGEGEYDVTENNIRFLLGLNKTQLSPYAELTMENPLTPETYLGYARANNYSSPEPMQKDVSASYKYPNLLDENNWALKGSWKIEPHKIVAQKAGSSLKIHFQAQDAFIVMGCATKKTIPVKIKLNGELLLKYKGRDVNESTIQVSQHTLYSLVKLNRYEDGILELTATEPGLEVYTFTFGK